jgi:hypothetical protein
MNKVLIHDPARTPRGQGRPGGALHAATPLPLAFAGVPEAAVAAAWAGADPAPQEQGT